ncbi:protein HOTHEAD [Cucurbita moschata]|uniref:Protein HOTHEAD n=1 Tax=Cucurbita moschata TaxID=3662 RepID=A0A6J1E887_CUCMO|nr:protein HOTHEAD [Cucurbita moschata]
MGFAWRNFFSAALAGILLCHVCSSAQKVPKFDFMRNAAEAPAVSHYDYIIVGGGTAGCPLAATLSENHNVLMLERGGSPYGNSNITNLSAFGAALADLSESSPSQRFVSEDGVINSRARVLGGGSCLNAGFYSRASLDYVREAGWDAKLVNESYEWVERVVAFEPRMGKWQSAVRGGLVDVGVVPDNGFTYDHLYGTKVGGTIFDRHGHRHTAADLLTYANPPNLTLFLYATAHTILFQTKGRKRPRAHGVVFEDSKGIKHRAYLRNGPESEVIISAGCLGSPQLLMLSGLGPAQHLKAHNITVLLDQPMVGQRVSDNPMNAVFVPSPVPVEVSLIEVVGITHNGTYIEAASGESFAGGPSSRDFGMFSPKIGQLSTVPPKQRTPEAIAEAWELMNKLDEAAFRGGFILEKIMGPLSWGHLELRTRDPHDNPSVTFNYFKDPTDLQRCVAGINIIRRIIESKSFAKFRYQNVSMATLLNMTASAPINLLPKHDNLSRSTEQYCRDTVMTIWHYHGGCQTGSVVDSDYRVLGVDSLRVVDGSTFHDSPGTNPQATVMMLGRYMGVRISRERIERSTEK